MELFIIVVAIIAVVAALFLLLLLQIRIKKQSSDSSVTSSTQETSLEEIADPDPNDPCYKTGPPPYIEVMKSPELYPLSSSCNIAFLDTKIEISPQPQPDNARSKRTWAQIMTAVLRSDDLVPNSPPRKNSAATNNEINTFLSTQQRNAVASTGDTTDLDVRDTPTNDEILPSYHEVCSDRPPREHVREVGQRNCSSESMSGNELGQCELLGYNRVEGRTHESTCAFTISNTLRSVVVEAATISKSRATTM